MREGRPEDVPPVMWMAGDAFLPKSVRLALDEPIIIVGAPVNGWSGMHLLSGILVERYGFSTLQAIIIHSGWELFQLSIGMTRYKSEDALDIFYDTFFYMIGYALSSRFC